MGEVFRINAANVMHEMIEDEVVIVNLDKGTYYSLDAVGAEVWKRVAEGCTLAALVDGVTALYDGGRDRVAAGIAAFLGTLQQENLVTASPEREEVRPSPAPPPGPARAYSDPVLQKYTDMEELLLVDPIHEVADSGWPDVT